MNINQLALQHVTASNLETELANEKDVWTL